jgi:hypothetical protein
VDRSNWTLKKVEYWDSKGKPLKTLTIDGVRKVEGIWTRHEMLMTNHRTGHSTRFIFTDVDYQTPVKDSMFTRKALERGH